MLIVTYYVAETQLPTYGRIPFVSPIWTGVIRQELTMIVLSATIVISAMIFVSAMSNASVTYVTFVTYVNKK